MIDVLAQEQKFNFNSFTPEDARNFGENVLNIVKEKQLKNVRIRVMLDGDIVYQYLMNGKKGDVWLNRKQQTVLAAKHASLYTFQNPEKYEYMKDDDTYVICGGGFPLIINGEIRGVFTVSGLDHEDDHMLIIEALERLQK